MASGRLKLTRAQLSSFLKDASGRVDFESIKQFENLFSTVDTFTNGGDTGGQDIITIINNENISNNNLTNDLLIAFIQDCLQLIASAENKAQVALDELMSIKAIMQSNATIEFVENKINEISVNSQYEIGVSQEFATSSHALYDYSSQTNHSFTTNNIEVMTQVLNAESAPCIMEQIQDNVRFGYYGPEIPNAPPSGFLLKQYGRYVELPDIESFNRVSTSLFVANELVYDSIGNVITLD